MRTVLETHTLVGFPETWPKSGKNSKFSSLICQSILAMERRGFAPGLAEGSAPFDKSIFSCGEVYVLGRLDRGLRPTERTRKQR